MSKNDWTVCTLRAELMRAARAAGDQAAFDGLCMYQHFDVSQIIDMACAAKPPPEDDVLIPTDLFLPAVLTWLEWHDKHTGERLALSLGSTEDGRINLSFCTRFSRTKQIELTPGSNVFRKHNSLRDSQATGLAALAIELLAIINQPGLCDVEPSTSRWIRAAAKGWVFGAVPTSWGRVTIRPGTHGSDAEQERAGTMPLHFVRAHRKPKMEAKLGRPVIIASRWRGNIANGLRLKEYLASEELAWAREKQRQHLAAAP